MASSSEAPDYDPKTDPARKAKSKDPGWKYAYWKDPARRDWVTCILCGHEASGGIKRFKEHLAGGYGDIILCRRVSTEIRIEMEAYLQKKRRRPLFLDDIEEEAEEEAGEPEDEVVEVAAADVQAAAKKPSSGTAAKRRRSVYRFKASKPSSGNTTPKTTKSVIDMIRRTPEQFPSRGMDATWEKSFWKGKKGTWAQELATNEVGNRATFGHRRSCKTHSMARNHHRASIRAVG